MATVTKTYTYDTTSQSFQFTPVNGSSGSYSPTGNPAGSLKTTDNVGGYQSARGTHNLMTTWAEMGVPQGATVTAVKCVGFQINPTNIGIENAGYSNITFCDGSSVVIDTFTGSPTVNTWQDRANNVVIPVPSACQASSAAVQINLSVLANSHSDPPGSSIRFDNISFVITYSGGSGTGGSPTSGPPWSAHLTSPHNRFVHQFLHVAFPLGYQPGGVNLALYPDWQRLQSVIHITAHMRGAQGWNAQVSGNTLTIVDNAGTELISGQLVDGVDIWRIGV